VDFYISVDYLRLAFKAVPQLRRLDSRLFAEEVWVLSQASPCEICAEQNGTWHMISYEKFCFPLSVSFSPRQSVT